MKKAFIFLTVAFIIYFACFYKSAFTLEGNWTAKEIILDGHKMLRSEIQDSTVLFSNDPKMQPMLQVQINDWTDSLYIIGTNPQIRAKIKLQYREKGKSYMTMSSNEKALNGLFELSIDTIRNNPNIRQKFTVDVTLKSKKAYLKLQRNVYPQQPRQAPFPQKGRP